MEPWVLALVLKPFAGLVVFAVLFGIPILLVRLLRPIFPEGRLKDVLFRERGSERAGLPPDPRQQPLDNVPLIRGERIEDSSRL